MVLWGLDLSCSGRWLFASGQRAGDFLVAYPHLSIWAGAQVGILPQGATTMKNDSEMDEVTYENLCDSHCKKIVYRHLVCCSLFGDMGEQRATLDAFLRSLDFTAAERLASRVRLRGIRPLSVETGSSIDLREFKQAGVRYDVFVVPSAMIEFIARACKRKKSFAVSYEIQSGGVHAGYLLPVIEAAISLHTVSCSHKKVPSAT